MSRAGGGAPPSLRRMVEERMRKVANKAFYRESYGLYYDSLFTKRIALQDHGYQLLH
jgi:hypothetical protein